MSSARECGAFAGEQGEREANSALAVCFVGVRAVMPGDAAAGRPGDAAADGPEMENPHAG